jgi:hypothetical protein
MPSPEQPSSEVPYLRVARFSDERPAGRAYNQLQDLIFRSPACDLSVYRLLLIRDWHVAVLGLPPTVMLERRIGQVLSRGIPSSLPEEVLLELQRRRMAATKIGPWVERHGAPPQG